MSRACHCWHEHVKDTGTARQWLISHRLMRARELLECAGSSSEQIAAGCGLTALMLRGHVSGGRGTAPQACRRTVSRASSAR